MGDTMRVLLEGGPLDGGVVECIPGLRIEIPYRNPEHDPKAELIAAYHGCELPEDMLPIRYHTYQRTDKMIDNTLVFVYLREG